MRKLSLTFALFSICTLAGAQTMYDALNWSENDYYGTAHSIGLGNAMTAVGGEIGSVEINPAGSATAGYSQISVTPGASISLNSSIGDATGATAPYFENKYNQTNARFIFPNGGFLVNFNTGKSRGLCGVTFGFVANSNNFYNSYSQCTGTNSDTSFAGYLANDATGYKHADLYNHLTGNWATSTAFCTGAYKDSEGNIKFSDAGVIEPMNRSGETGLDNGKYLGITENRDSNTGKITLGGPINQNWRKKVTGSKMDYILNLGLNFNDKFYFGANLGLLALTYRYDEGIRESSQEHTLFQSGFNSLDYKYYQRTSGSGVYGKFGLIINPVNSLRIGATIQTPSSMTITDTYSHSFDFDYYKTDSQVLTQGYASSPVGQYRYKLISPMRASVGVSYTFVRKVLLSVDYEFCPYNQMKFKEYDTFETNTFEKTNQMINGTYSTAVGTTFMGASNMVRVGVEYKPITCLAVRLGYNYNSSPLRYWATDPDSPTEVISKTNKSAETQNCSLGIGYSSNGSFFCDAALRWTFRPSETTQVYENYISNVASPVIVTTRQLVSVVATVGWRF